MPENIRNRIHMKGIAKMPFFIEENGEKQFDFEKFIPEPEYLSGDGNREWRIQVWGTKWNAYCTEIDGEDDIYFFSAWDAPLAVIRALAALCPEEEVEYWWASENVGDNSGYGYSEDGAMGVLRYPYKSSKALAAYLKVWYPGREETCDYIRKDPETGGLYVDCKSRMED